jgi:hypothetical protein
MLHIHNQIFSKDVDITHIVADKRQHPKTWSSRYNTYDMQKRAMAETDDLRIYTHNFWFHFLNTILDLYRGNESGNLTFSAGQTRNVSKTELVQFILTNFTL